MLRPPVCVVSKNLVDHGDREHSRSNFLSSGVRNNAGDWVAVASENDLFTSLHLLDGCLL